MERTNRDHCDARECDNDQANSREQFVEIKDVCSSAVSIAFFKSVTSIVGFLQLPTARNMVRTRPMWVVWMGILSVGKVGLGGVVR